MTVYNPDKCTVEGNGLYVWNGLVWGKLGENSIAALVINPSLIPDDNADKGILTLDMPCGRDRRALTSPYKLSFTFPDGAVSQQGAGVGAESSFLVPSSSMFSIPGSYSHH